MHDVRPAVCAFHRNGYHIEPAGAFSLAGGMEINKGGFAHLPLLAGIHGFKGGAEPPGGLSGPNLHKHQPPVRFADQVDLAASCLPVPRQYAHSLLGGQIGSGLFFPPAAKRFAGIWRAGGLTDRIG
ncbi:hypothetical protein D3C81_1875580 [compost metagenome]